MERGEEKVDNAHLKIVTLILVACIAVLLFAFVMIGSMTSGSNGQIDERMIIHPESMMQGEARIIEKELYVKGLAGNETFQVDESWSAIGIYVEVIASTYYNLSVTEPGFPEGAFTVNGTVYPFMGLSGDPMDGAFVRGQTSPLTDEPRGNWTLNYDVGDGVVKIYIVKVVLADTYLGQ